MVLDMADMERRTTVILAPEDDRALAEAARVEGLSQSELIRRGIAIVTAPYRKRRKPRVGWLRLTRGEVAALMDDEFGDRDV
jgi:hypothetical protein